MRSQLGRDRARFAAQIARSIPCSGIPVSADPVVGAYAFQTDEVGPRDVLRQLFNAADDARTSGRVIASYNENS